MEMNHYLLTNHQSEATITNKKQHLPILKPNFCKLLRNVLMKQENSNIL